MREFDFIRRYLQAGAQAGNGVVVGIGDDAAVVRADAESDWCISSDMLVGGRHFFFDTAPEDLAHKVLAVNLSDMAAMGAVPRWVLLSMALPELDEAWISRFSGRFFAMCREYGVALIGGDTTRGGWVFSVTVIGEVPRGRALTRSAAQAGDDIWVSGQLGWAAAGLQHCLKTVELPPACAEQALAALLRPTPRVALGRLLLPLAHAAQDVSDGLVQDLGHILTASGVGGRIYWPQLPLDECLAAAVSPAQYRDWVLAGGDDYELVFTAPPSVRTEIRQAAQAAGVAVSLVGEMTAEPGLRIVAADGSLLPQEKTGFDHFSDGAVDEAV
ncbi:thiamine-phosphate kinase [Neisseria leonii]|uniref:Thiamine-monophosphate kinase n=1 Tax=Neisseria leonii TaxID=2995413 RepID=A0A9X4E448_9NEIS|nr:thiamine-phosphate kinase [Neisseria sp. 51.81]MDD9328395.1 thiamine-phosphate kinase [Neisseria sp. 51.81]